MVTGQKPVSAENLSAALGADAQGDIGMMPVCVDNLNAVLSGMACRMLYYGPEVADAELSGDVADYDRIIVLSLEGLKYPVIYYMTPDKIDGSTLIYGKEINADGDNTKFSKKFSVAGRSFSMRSNFGSADKYMTHVIGVKA